LNLIEILQGSVRERKSFFRKYRIEPKRN